MNLYAVKTTKIATEMTATNTMFVVLERVFKNRNVSPVIISRARKSLRKLMSALGFFESLDLAVQIFL